MPCADLFTTGHCKFGDRCLFSHEFDIIPKEDPASHPPPYTAQNQFEDGHFHNSPPSVPSSSKTSPSTQSATLPSANTPSSTNSRLPDVSQTPPNSNRRRGGQSSSSKSRRRAKRLHQNGVPVYFPVAPMYFGPGPFAPWVPPSLYRQPGFMPGYHHPSPTPLTPSLLEDDEGWITRKSSTETEKAETAESEASKQTARFPRGKDGAKVTRARPHAVPAQYYLGPQAALYQPLAFKESEVYDFDDVEEEEHIVVEPVHSVERYLGSKVGVLGGGVKLGVAKTPSSGRSEPTETPSQKAATLDEDDYEEDDDDVEIVDRSLEPHEVPLPSTDSESEDEAEDVISDLKKLQIDCSSTSIAPQPPTATSAFSWADDEDDESYFTSSLPFSPFTPAKDGTRPTQVSQSPPSKLPPSKPLSYAAIAAVKSPSQHAIKASKFQPFSIPASTTTNPNKSSSVASTANDWTTSTKPKTRANSSSRNGSSPQKDSSKQGEGGTRKRGRTFHVAGSDQHLVRASWGAPKIYGKLGFNMSNNQAREVELLRLVEQKKLRESREGSEDEEEAQELEIRATDNLIVAAKTEDHVSSLEVYVYDESEDNLYAHHDILLPSFPVCLEWLDYPPSSSTSETKTGNYIAVGTLDPDIEIWSLDVIESMFPDALLGDPKNKTRDETGAPVMVPSPTKKKDRKRRKPKANPEYHIDAVLGLSWNRSHRNLLASASADKTVKLWDLSRELNSAAIRSFDLHQDKVQAVQWNRVEPTVLLTGSYDRTVRTFDSRSPTSGFGAKLPSDVEALKWDPWEGHSFYVSLENGLVLYYDARTLPSDLSKDATARFTLQAHDGAASGLDVNPHVRGLIATGGTDSYVKLWNVTEDQGAARVKMLTSRNLEVGKVFSVTWSPDEPLTLAAAGSEGKLQIWDVAAKSGVKEALGDKLPHREWRQRNSDVIGVADDAEDDSDDEEE
ncbi:hypothetical protein FRB90_011254 [Tulasnella sp. 427]|nr:hypothetical protein FRB90_011254 [Tulasnella sp. 427]